MNEQFLSNKLKKRAESGLLRSLKILPKDNIDFSSNDYLGLSKNKDLINSLNKLTLNETGSTGSRLLTGNYHKIEELECDLATYFKSETALLFNSGYTANTGLLSCIAEKSDIILYDEGVHASLREGIQLSNAKAWKFRHNNLTDLENKLEKAKNHNNIFVVIEALYSMDGDVSSLQEILELCNTYNAKLILDESHSVGTIGNTNQGLALTTKSVENIFARIVTFGKAMNAQGACILGSNTLKKYLVNFSKPFIYTTAPSPILVELISNNFLFFKKAEKQKVQLNSLVKYYLSKNTSNTIFSSNNSPIQYILLGSNKKTIAYSKTLINNNINALAILSPTVKEGSERIRINLHSFNTKEQINLLYSTLNKTQ